MNVVNFDHYNIETVKPEETVCFYSEQPGETIYALMRRLEDENG